MPTPISDMFPSSNPLQPLRLLKSVDEIGLCFDLMRLLRPELLSQEDFTSRVLELQRSADYQLLAMFDSVHVVGLLGFRVLNNLMHGRHLYIDDLVTARDRRRLGIGARLLMAAGEEADRLGCGRILLDTALDNEVGIRFYVQNGFTVTAHRFVKLRQP